MNIFFFSSKKFMKICSKTHQIARSKKFSRGSIPPNAPSKRHASQAASRNATRPAPKSCPPLTNHTYSHGLLLRNLFEEIRS